MEEQKESNLHQPMFFGGRVTTHKWCDTCIFCEVIPSIGRQPQTRYCRIFEPNDSDGKPDEVIYDGEPCEYYEPDKQT